MGDRGILLLLMGVVCFALLACEGGGGANAPTLVATATTPTAVHAATAPSSTLGPTQTTASSTTGNFRLLISDEENAIGDFARLLVTFDGFEIERASGGWYPDDGLLVPQTPTVDLVQLQGAAAQAIWEGDVEETRYIKLRLIPIDPAGVRGELAPEGGVPDHLDPEGDFDADGVLNRDDNCRFIGNGADGDAQADSDGDGIGDACSIFVELPSGRFEWEPRDAQGKPAGFTVGGVDPINFVFDFSVVRRGPLGDNDYLVQPEIGDTGPYQTFVEAKDQEKNDEGEEFTLQLGGEPRPGTNSTLAVTDEAGHAVAGASVRLKVEGLIGDTDSEGRLSLEIPVGTLKLRLEAEKDDADGEMAVKFGEDGAAETDTENDGLSLRIEGEIRTGTTVTLLIWDDQDNPVPDVKVSIKIERDAGLTDEEGLVDIEIPAYAEELSLEAHLDDQRGELEIEFTQGRAQALADGDGSDQERDAG